MFRTYVFGTDLRQWKKNTVAVMGTWILEDIPWDEFDPEKVAPDILRVVKAASLVEFNADDYRRYLQNVFKDDAKVCSAIGQWSIEEVQHGRALGMWAEMADPDFDFERSFRTFTENFRVQLDATASVRGSRSGEMIARCMVETGTDSFYSALGDATEEPVLKAICRRIAADEFAHYCLFHASMSRYLQRENLTFPERLKVAFERVAETEDDELATAYWAANAYGEHFDRRRNSVAYARDSLQYYRPQHVARGVEMIFKAIGLNPAGPLGWAASRAVRTFIWYRIRLMPRLAVVRARLFGHVSRLEFLQQRT